MSEAIIKARFALDALIVYRKLLDDPVIHQFLLLLQEATTHEIRMDRFIRCYCDFCNLLLDKSRTWSFSDYLAERIMYMETAFSLACEREPEVDINPGLQNAVVSDLTGLKSVALLLAEEIKAAVLQSGHLTLQETEIVKTLPEWTAPLPVAWTFDAEVLAERYRRYGAGTFARYAGFVWQRKGQDGELVGITSPDPIRLQDLIGYEEPRQRVMDNTLMFLKGNISNNVLLYGDRGTGKSSTVKALLNEYAHLGLRMIELPKPYLADLPQLLRLVAGKPQKFIIFVDDLAFSDHEETFTALKAVLEGGLESRPRNVVIYATSNRRHLIKERFSDRMGLYSGNMDDEVRSAETIQEKLSLADRFGITVTFLSPDQRKYLEIVDGLAQQRGLYIDKEVLHQEALKWERWQNGRSPRTARQFIDWLQGQLGAKNL